MDNRFVLLAFFFLVNGPSLLRASIQEECFTPREKALIFHIKHSIREAEREISRLSSHHLLLEGRESCKTRHFLNHLCTLKNSCFLHIGCTSFSTWLSSLFTNEESVLEALLLCTPSEVDFCHFSMHPKFRILDFSLFFSAKHPIFKSPVNIIFFDPDHFFVKHEKAFFHCKDSLDDLFILIVMDWNWQKVQRATRHLLEQCCFKIIFNEELPESFNPIRGSFWDGILVALVRRGNCNSRFAE